MPAPSADFNFRPCWTVFICFLAVALGGSTAAGPQGILWLSTGTLFLLAPPRRLPEFPWLLLFVAFTACLLGGFLPARWFSEPEWRQSLQLAGLKLPTTRSVQPWISAEQVLLSITSMLWAYYLLAQDWSVPARLRAAKLYVIAIAALATIALGAYLSGISIPLWSPAAFGFFPNRNQSANVIALAAVLVFGLIWSNVGTARKAAAKNTAPPTSAHSSPPPPRERRPQKSHWAWFLLLPVSGIALVADSSRAGICLFFGGSAAAIALALFWSHSKRSAALSLAGMLVLMSGFFLFGGETLRRFEPRGPTSTELRGPIQTDALALSRLQPALGVGLGNFESVFAMYRDASAGQNRAKHPESDWLWTALECGWVSVVLLLVMLGFWIKQCSPFTADSVPFLRVTALLCGLGFSAHGLIDVSGHRLGTLWPAIFLASLAVHPLRNSKPARWLPRSFQIIGIAFIGLGLWLVNAWTRPVAQNEPIGWTHGLPSQQLDRLENQLQIAIEADQYEQIIELTTAGLRIAPLEWRFYFQRAAALLLSEIDLESAERDFNRVRQLQPRWIDASWNEGVLWKGTGHFERAIGAWKLALQKAERSAPAPELYARMLEVAGTDQQMRDGLRPLAGHNRSYWICFIRGAKDPTLKDEIHNLLQEDPTLRSLTGPQKRELFELWYQSTDQAQLIEALKSQPLWQSDGWPLLARHAIASGDFETAFRWARKMASRPVMPTLTNPESTKELERRYRYQTDDIALGITLAQALQRDGQLNAALQLVQSLRKMNAAPAYLAFMEAELWSQLGDWQQAYRAWPGL